MMQFSPDTAGDILRRFRRARSINQTELCLRVEILTHLFGVDCPVNPHSDKDT